MQKYMCAFTQERDESTSEECGKSGNKPGVDNYPDNTDNGQRGGNGISFVRLVPKAAGTRGENGDETSFDSSDIKTAGSRGGNGNDPSLASCDGRGNGSDHEVDSCGATQNHLKFSTFSFESLETAQPEDFRRKFSFWK
jgi:hypothetical protein